MASNALGPVSDDVASQNLAINIRLRVNPENRSHSSVALGEFEKHDAAHGRDPIALLVQPLWIQLLDQFITEQCDNDGVKVADRKDAFLDLATNRKVADCA
ncbi:hypothetical protein WN982_16800 [Paraburkholderia sp. IMGN_8]|uniref:hypothetical protein n=1 Tax=Paraburkholderia sp. IMGN_8 TaxID=3136564 RepID=UPI003100D498